MVTFRSYQSDDRAWVKESNSWFYQNFHDFDATFTVAVSAALEFLEGQMSKPTSNYLIVEAANRPVGCIFFNAETPTVGRIRLFYLEQAYRGQGIGMRLLRNILTDARKNGFKAVRVSTFDRHPEACRLYEFFGFEVLNINRSEAFGQVMQQIDYELLLAGGER
ncbi:MAG: GNAT family N-acetyltransferase [Pseudoruegeria sp.]